jgi:PAS domain-containing protein
MERTGAKPLALILARELAANVATPMLIVDRDGTLVYYNEPGEAILGESFARTGEVPLAEWGARWQPERLDGSAYDVSEFPLARALNAKRPASDTLRFTAADGGKRTVTVAAYPLLARSDEFAGAVAIFWESHP